MGESERRNILGKEDGFNTRVNLFIIRHMYYHMKKAEQFMVEGEGKRKNRLTSKHTYPSRHTVSPECIKGKILSLLLTNQRL